MVPMRSLASALALAGALVACSVGLPERAEDLRGSTGQATTVAASGDAGPMSVATPPPPPPTDAGVRPNPPPDGAPALPPMCPPKTISTFNMTPWVPPAALHKNACTASQVQVMVECMFTSVGSNATCQQFFDSYANDNCLSCAISSQLSSKAGPILDDGQAYWTNPAPCMSALQGDSTNASCGAKWNLMVDCEVAACGHCSDADYWDCVLAADKGVCAQYATAAQCSTVYESSCISESSLVDEAQKLVKIFCMP
jgi:hypothetical protein